MNKSVIALLGFSCLGSLALASIALADPVNETLTIDGEEMITVAPAPTEPPGHVFEQVESGWLYREAETRATQMDSFENPGMLNVERGEEIWNTVDGAAGKSCATCHEDASETMAGVGANYPKWNAKAGKPFNLELQVDACRTENMQAEPYKFDAQDQKDLVTFIRHQSLGEPVDIDLAEGEMMSWWEKGKERYYLRTGQLDLSCASCHESANGKYIRADHLSQGQTNGFPTYRFNTGGMVSLHNRFRGCVRDTRAEMPKAFSDELMALEVYTAWRGQGLSVETPAVRQ
ncbi:sulfur oxidation c-type cytochrome SoxA [Aurantimonas endophytica]|uniref:SoxAX cytochrome complex subunit A n=1 Tax=Aurantimonas endophytica TaxID=1522175 RepID=A0A7W6HF33_9HYPH|nr:sulfur oxidation c-type cytochrome SoxA [Aurantimonas endophytica]MBB4004075.1 sulfur-oxidizing protein SoxA [Aurantimonas endophytica]MCO6404921.1 sulfur oxidation c-type cytochrome SoxA [Aurantimonas endophytica]